MRGVVLSVVVLCGLTLAAAGSRSDESAPSAGMASPEAHLRGTVPWSKPTSRIGSYGWPVRPFHRQHAVRGVFGDPRLDTVSDDSARRSLHFGVDVVAPDWTPVYATITGRVSIHPLHGDTVIVSDGSGRAFEYWHVVPVVSSGQANAYSTVVGLVEPGWQHVHFAERIGSGYVNPLRPGGMGPYADDEPPHIAGVRFERRGNDVGRTVSGAVDIVIDAFDCPVMPLSGGWEATRLAPALIRWRVVPAGKTSRPSWRVSFDARWTLPETPFASVYAPGTRKNGRGRPGWYLFYLVQAWDSTSRPPGAYHLEVSVADVRGNEVTKSVQFVIVRH